MRKTLSLAALGLLLGSLAGPALADPEAAASRLTARAVTGGAVRSNTLLPADRAMILDNPVRDGLSSRSGWNQAELDAALSKQYSVDLVAVANYLYTPEGVAFLSESIGGNSYTPYRSQANQVQAVRSAIIADSVDGQLSGYGMMANLPTDQRLQGPMKSCISSGNAAQETSLLGWYVTTPACIQQRTAQAMPQAGSARPAPQGGTTRGMW